MGIDAPATTLTETRPGGSDFLGMEATFSHIQSYLLVVDGFAWQPHPRWETEAFGLPTQQRPAPVRNRRVPLPPL